MHEPAGNTCICVKNILSVVNIDTASSGQGGLKELRLAGLKNPHDFKKLVWAMKRSQGSAGSGVFSQVPAALEMARCDTKNNNEPDVTSILLQIRDELRTHNDLLHRMQTKEENSSSQTAKMTTADVEEDICSRSKSN